ncbi:MAG: hypothetical protein LBS90_06575 [Oscillospiraceae bacterium]|jgi:hypothetical protein|nr:hypothetical protein [Oscillospiraceae bacterium]
MQESPESLYKSACFTRGIADGMPEVGAEESVRKAERYNESLDGFRAAGEYLDSARQADEVSAVIRGIVRRLNDIRDAETRSRRRRLVIDLIVLVIPLAIIVAGAALLTLSADDSPVPRGVVAGGCAALGVLVIVGVIFAVFTRERENPQRRFGSEDDENPKR